MTNELVDLIGNVGFPIVISLVLFYQLMKTKDMMIEFQKIITMNTMTIEKLIQELDEKKME